MFCNGLRMDEGDLARPRPVTIAGMTSLEVLFVPDHDCGRHRRLTWAHQKYIKRVRYWQLILAKANHKVHVVS